MSEENYYGQGPTDAQGVEMQPSGQLYSMPAGGPNMYGDGQASLTDMRTSYGSSMPGMLAYGAASGISVVGHGAYMGASRMMADLGGMVRPISYTAPARVYTGYSGRVQQQTGLGSSLGAMFMREAPRGTSPYLYGLNASTDVGERMAGAAGGLAVSAATIAAADITSRLGGAAFGAPGMIAGGLMGYMAAGYAADRVYEGVAARRTTQDYLERTSSTYIGSGSADADPRRGAGFSRAARQDISEHIRGMDIGDRMMGTDDLQRILEKSTELGMFSGTRDVEGFKKKFKTIVENVKAITTTLNTTIEEGLQTMKELKGVGITEAYSGTAALQAQTLGKMSGRSAMEMVNLGLQGAEIYRGTGVSMSIGFQSNMMNLAAVRASRDAGLISQEAVAQAGGEEALAQRMTGTTLAYTQSALGRGLGAVYAGGGGAFNSQAFLGTLGGGTDIGQAAQQAARNLSNPKALLEYEVNQEKFRSEQGRMFGGRGLDIGMMSEVLMQAANLKTLTGAGSETSALYILKNQGHLSDSEARARLGELKDPSKFFDAQQKAAQGVLAQTLGDQAVHNSAMYRVGAAVDDAAKAVFDVAAAPISRSYDVMAEEKNKFVEKRVYGLERFSMKGTGYEAFENLPIPEGFAQRRGADLRRNTLFARKGGAALAKALSKVQGDRSSVFADAGLVQGESDVVLDSGIFGGSVSQTSEAFDRGVQKSRMISAISPERAQMLQEQGVLDKILPGAEAKVLRLLSSGESGSIKNMDELGKAVFGAEAMTEAQYAALTIATKGSRFEESAKRDREVALAYSSAKAETYTMSQQESVKKIGEAKDALGISGLIPNSEAEGLYVRSLLAKSGTERASLIQEAEAVLYKSGSGGFVESEGWKDMTRRTVTAGMRATANVYRDEQYVMSARRADYGSHILSTGMSHLLAGDTRLSEEEKRSVVDTSVFIGSNVATARAFVADEKKYTELQKILSKTEVTTEFSERLAQVKGVGVLENMKDVTDPVKRKEALALANVPSGLQEGIIEKYQRLGSGAAEDFLSSPLKAAAGTEQVAGAGVRGGTSSPTGSAQDAMALQTSINTSTLKAFEALARRFGAM